MSTYIKIILLLTLFCGVVITNKYNNSDNNLYLVHILFRHGDRTPQRSYPKDIYTEEAYSPNKFGELLDKGKRITYDLGLSLKNRYKNFLGSTHNQCEVVARSSPLLRTRLSCEYVMEGLFRSNPKKKDLDLNLHATSCEFVPAKGNMMFLADQNCKKLRRVYNELIRNDERNGKFKQYTNLFNDLTKYSGWNITTPATVTKVYDILRCQNEMGLKLPKWASDVFLSRMIELSLTSWDYIANNEDMKRYNAGNLLKTIMDDTKKKINKTENNENKKLSLYCGHDTNIIALLGILGVYPREILPYAAALIIEVHRVNDQFIIKVLYQHGKKWNPQLMTLPGCPDECTLENFESVFQKYYDTKDLC